MRFLNMKNCNFVNNARRGPFRQSTGHWPRSPKCVSAYGAPIIGTIVGPTKRQIPQHRERAWDPRDTGQKLHLRDDWFQPLTIQSNDGCDMKLEAENGALLFKRGAGSVFGPSPRLHDSLFLTSRDVLTPGVRRNSVGVSTSTKPENKTKKQQFNNKRFNQKTETDHWLTTLDVIASFAGRSSTKIISIQRN